MAPSALALNGKNKQLALCPWDAIVIGSGIGGLTTAASLAKCKRRVLVLEQHYEVGGATHMFSRKGFKWDVGVHCIGSWNDGSLVQKVVAWLSNGEVEMEHLGHISDTVTFPGDPALDIPGTQPTFLAALIDRFPDSEKEIRDYVAAVNAAGDAARFYMLDQTLPRWLARLVEPLSTRFGKQWWVRRSKEVVDSLVTDPKLAAFLLSWSGYYGSRPSHSSFAVHALIVRHYWDGAYYPTGGARVFADSFSKTICEAGGEVVTRAPVDKIIVRGNRATGVRLADGTEISAPIIVSAAGARTTVQTLLPDDVRPKVQRWREQVMSLPMSPAHLNLFLGFKGDIVAAGATKPNQWFFNTWDLENNLWDVGDPTAEPPFLYISFPSLKDPMHDPGDKQRHTGQCITFISYDWFRKWQGTEWRKRGDDYLAFKASLERRFKQAFISKYPAMADLITHCELSTPLSTEYFLRAPEGAIYGLALNVERYQSNALRIRTPIKGLVLSGSDVALNGVAGALTGGLLTAVSLMPSLFKLLV